MMSEIYHRGPIVCSISTPDDFTYGYRGGLYDDPKNYTKETIDHNVEVDSNSQQPLKTSMACWDRLALALV